MKNIDMSCRQFEVRWWDIHTEALFYKNCAQLNILRQSTELAVLTHFMDLSPFRNLDIVDNMLQMMEKYTDQLEDLVDERTRQLEIEKAKTEELLYKMLPK